VGDVLFAARERQGDARADLPERCLKSLERGSHALENDAERSAIRPHGRARAGH
jgi:hypothetical protein